MPKHAPDHDPKQFAERLKEAMAAEEWKTGYGAGTALARKYKVNPVTGNAWLNGEHMPSPEIVRQMARDLRHRYEWLYFGELPRRPGSSVTGVAREIGPLTEHEQRLIRRYRAMDEAMQGLVDAALDIRQHKK